MVSGGPVSRIDVSGVRLELYGRAVERYTPGFFEGELDPNETAYDFFLVRRFGSDNATVLEQWMNIARGESRRALAAMTQDAQKNAAHVQIKSDANVVVDRYYYPYGL